MPQTSLSIFRPVLNSPTNEQILDLAMSPAPPLSEKPQRHSMGVTFGGIGETSLYDHPGVNSITSSTGRPLSLQSSYSTNDVPTVKNSLTTATNITPSKAYAEQQFHNHNASLGRVPTSGGGNRQSRDFAVAPGTAESKRDDKCQSMQSLLQASAPPFGPHVISTADSNALSTSVVSYVSNVPASAYGYGMQTYNLSSNPVNNQLQTLQTSHNAYPTYGGYGRLHDSQTRVVHQRRQQSGSDVGRYENVPIEHYRGQLYELCKDQHGCRYLQKRLEEKNAEHTMLIFSETCPYVVELMTGMSSKRLLISANGCRPIRQLSLPEIARVLG